MSTNKTVLTNCETVKGLVIKRVRLPVSGTYPSETSWCCCHAAMEPKEGPAGEPKPDSSALFRE